MVPAMRTLLFVAALAGAATGCSKAGKPHAEASAVVPTLTVDQVDQQLAKGECQPVDANGEPTRKKLGVLPGAVLLSDSEEFKLTELPADKSKELVFYCANTHCGASHQAASKAIAAGYENVRVMPEGIAGWVKAGKKTQSL
jgi:rhodanese-related sulfurtransferase